MKQIKQLRQHIDIAIVKYNNVEPQRFFDQNIPTEVGYALHNNLLSQVSTPVNFIYTSHF